MNRSGPGLWIKCAHCGARSRYPVYPNAVASQSWFRKVYRDPSGVRISHETVGRGHDAVVRPVFECPNHGRLGPIERVETARLEMRSGATTSKTVTLAPVSTPQ